MFGKLLSAYLLERFTFISCPNDNPTHSLPHYIKAFVGIPSWVSITLRLISTQVVIEGMIGKGSSGGIAVDDIIIANHILPEQCKGRLLNIG